MSAIRRRLCTATTTVGASLDVTAPYPDSKGGGLTCSVVLGKKLKGSEYCSEIGEGEVEGEYTTSECTTKGVGKFIKAKLALPDVQPGLEGEKFPVAIARTLLTTSFSIESELGEKITGEGLSLLLLSSESSVLISNTLKAVYLNVESGKSKCNTTGDPTGLALTSGTFLVVRLSKTSLAIGVVLSPSEFELACGTSKIKIKGSMLASLSAGEEATELQTVLLKLSGSKGKPELTKYVNYEEGEVTTSLLSNFGLGFEKADESFGQVTLLATKGMFVIPGR